MKKLIVGFLLGISLVLGVSLFTNASLMADELDAVVETTEETETIQAFAELYGIEFFKAAAILKLVDADAGTVDELLALSNEDLFDRLQTVYGLTHMDRPNLDLELVGVMETLIDTYDLDPGEAMKITLLSAYTDYTVDALLELSEDDLDALFESVNEDGLLPVPGSLMRNVMGRVRGIFESGEFPGRGRGPMHRHRPHTPIDPDVGIPDTPDPTIDPSSQS